MQETKGLLDPLWHHDKLPLMINENCRIALPEEVLGKLQQPHKLSFYYFVYIDQGSETYTIDLQDITISAGQLIFGLPNQIFTNPIHSPANHHYHLSFDEHTLALLPQTYAFLLNPLQTPVITFDPEARQRVRALQTNVFQLLHAAAKPPKAEIVLAHLNALLTEYNSAYFEGTGHQANTRSSKYVEFKLIVETHLTEQQDVHTIAAKMGMTTSSLYALVKENAGVSPKEWITNRLILEAQRQLQYSSRSVKELAYDLGFNDPSYFSRLFKKKTGKSVSDFSEGLRDLSST
ncbi:AraC family transcriptional regulator [Siphonobacter sp. SORGH_AS_0500]|uniref:helix-turn-helix domain-containing protein n=1 Tax=Siphonobacter sp. SORGH_AS_0500 TaxID=1864824 RepID=UPI00285BF179|nr:AraC family transcriptional regulator [Siphonobacter sp. SORGH_AS_0500]MDR6197720.1 AraC family transcriptional activator of pobA [Siphonobacter sp. SORGH_AS_0500]